MLQPVKWVPLRPIHFVFFLVGMTFSFPVLVVLVVVMVVVLVVAMVVGTGDGVTRSNKQSSSDMTAASEQQFPPLAI